MLLPRAPSLIVGTLAVSCWLWPGACAAAPAPAPGPCIGVEIRPADAANINAIIDGQAEGTTFCFNAGLYKIGAPIQTKDGDSLICTTARRCIVDGANRTARGFETLYEAKNEQRISGFVVRNFKHAGLLVRPRGRAENNEVYGCEVGIVVDGAVVGNHIHHNRRYGISGGPGDNILIQDNEIAFNNTARHDPNDDAGGTKIVGSKAGANVTWRGNKVHHNHGNGIWQDGNVTRTLYENNKVYANTGTGILHEISWSAIIRNNVVANNNLVAGSTTRSCWHGAQIALNNSQGVEIYGNTVTGGFANGICLVNSRRSEAAPFPTALANVKVHDNTIKMRGRAKTGFAGDSVPRGIKFYANRYYLDDASGAFWQGAGDKTKAEWQALGHDADGVFRRW